MLKRLNKHIMYMDATGREVIEKYYYLLEQTLKVYDDLSGHPAQIYNMDESGLPLLIGLPT